MGLNSSNGSDEGVEQAKAAINDNPNERIISPKEIAAGNVRVQADEESAKMLSDKIKGGEEISLEDLLNQTMVEVPHIRLINLGKDIPEGGCYNVYVAGQLVLEGKTDDEIDIPFMNFEGIKPGTNIKIDFLDVEGNSVFVDEGEIN